MTDTLKAPARPCGSCPYRRDVPSGVWSPEEYAKLPQYDGETWEQHPAVFMCHQRDGCLCSGWLTTHDRRHLLALRFNTPPIDPSVWSHAHDIPCFESGAEAAAHGMRDVGHPGPEARALMQKIEKVLPDHKDDEDE